MSATDTTTALCARVCVSRQFYTCDLICSIRGTCLSVWDLGTVPAVFLCVVKLSGPLALS